MDSTPMEKHGIVKGVVKIFKMPAKIIYKEGDMINGLVFKSNTPSETMGGQTRRSALFLCFCGKIFKTRINDVKAGKVSSCGCLNWMEKHGYAKKKGSGTIPEYNIWLAMKSRCFNPLAKRYDLYGGRGITICERWVNNFESFITDVGRRPSKDHSIDRINNNGNYSCGLCPECLSKKWDANCRWATREEQQNNRSATRYLEYEGEKKSLSQWAEAFGLSVGGLTWRLDKLRWSVKDSLETPKRKLKMDAQNIRNRQLYKIKNSI